MRLMYTHYKLLNLVEGKEKMPEAAELKGAWMERSFDTYMLTVQAVGGRQVDHIKDLLGDPYCGPKAWRKLLDVHSPTHATGIVLLARRLCDIKFVDGDLMQPVLDEMRDIFTKLQGGGVVYPELAQCVEIVIRLPESWSALASNLNSQQPRWSVDYIRARILEDDLLRRSVERSEEGAGYGVGGGKSGFKNISADIVGGSATNDPRIGPHLLQATNVVARGVGESWELVERRRRWRKAANVRSERPGSSSSS
ncbi:unnamed protein product [Closterium sp. NIES-64]|nr:unnamed protein product [Closterium sp. NIES-64]